MRMNVTKSFLAILGFAALASVAGKAHAAGGTGKGTVSFVSVGAPGNSALNYVSFTPISSFSSPCSGDSKTFILPSSSTDQGKAMLNVLTAAMLSGKAVNVTGTGSCAGLGSAPVSLEIAAQVVVTQ